MKFNLEFEPVPLRLKVIANTHKVTGQPPRSLAKNGMDG